MYEIIIKKTVTKEVPGGGKWDVIEKRPLTSNEIEKSYSEPYWKQEDIKKETKTVYGYTPASPYTEIEKSEIEILRQKVEELDLIAVIKAINGI